jgi:hypothetical protein
MPHYDAVCKSIPISGKKKPPKKWAALSLHGKTDDTGEGYAAFLKATSTSANESSSLFRHFGHSRAAKLALTVIGVKFFARL